MITALIATLMTRVKKQDGYEMNKQARLNRFSTAMAITLSTVILSGCTTLFEPKPDESPAQNEDETTRMENYVECLRDKDRKVENPPCLMK